VTERRFDGRVAVITGAGRGLGREYARLLGSKGAKVVVNDPGSSVKGEGVDAGPAEQVVREIKSLGGNAAACTESVATPEGGRAIVAAALDQYGRIVLTSSIGGLYGTHNVVNYGVSKTGMIGLNNIVAIEGAAKGVKCNIIAPGAVTRMAEGLDISQYPPMGPELVAPVVGWLAHESCSITGEMLISMAGRVARALIAETVGVYRPSWSIDEVGEQIDAIRDTDKLWMLPPVPSGYVDHLTRSFDMARKGLAAANK
jgi:NAD(P)-dependent dehydrogenase (short-subunit alcohol dehydrogenase family)